MKGLVRSNRGQAMVEMVLVLPLLLILVMGIVEFGFMFNNYLTLNHVSREAARYASLGGTDADAQARAYEIATSLDTSRLTLILSPAGNNRDRGDSVEARVAYTHYLLTPFLSTMIADGIELEAKTIMRVE